MIKFAPSGSIAAWLAGQTAPLTLVYASTPHWPLSAAVPAVLRISVLDSSFNPPTRAHLALARHPGTPPFDSSLLLLSTTNADKAQGSDETSSRLEMMRELAKESRIDSIALAVCSEPTFVRKSSLLKRELERIALEQGSQVDVRLSFSQGWDTLVRMFDGRYYQPPAASMADALGSFFETDKSTIVCARRGDVSPAEEAAFFAKPEVQRFAHGVEMITLDKEVTEISSSEVRRVVREAQGDELRVIGGVKKLVTNQVVDYIIEKDLYRL